MTPRALRWQVSAPSAKAVTSDRQQAPAPCVLRVPKIPTGLKQLADKPVRQYVKSVINVLAKNKNIFIVARITIKGAARVLPAKIPNRFQHHVEQILTQDAPAAQFVKLVCLL